MGGFWPSTCDEDLKEDLRLWRALKWKMLVSVSSTFTDTKHERNILREKIQPKMRELAS
jgi:hypothetical protein